MSAIALVVVLAVIASICIFTVTRHFYLTTQKTLLGIIDHLWTIIDDIDTYSDMAKSDDVAYRQLVEDRQADRWHTGLACDGYNLVHPSLGLLIAGGHPIPEHECEPVEGASGEPTEGERGIMHVDLGDEVDEVDRESVIAGVVEQAVDLIQPSATTLTQFSTKRMFHLLAEGHYAPCNVADATHFCTIPGAYNVYARANA